MSERTIFAETLARISRPLTLTHLGMVAERLARSFWPLWTVLILALAILMLGLQDLVRIEVVWAVGAILAVLGVLGLGYGLWTFRWPGRGQALRRLDSSLQGRPLQTLRDSQTIGSNDFGSQSLWRAHQARMADRAAAAKSVEPDLRVSSRDRFGLRFVALTVLMVALLFGSFWRVGSVASMAPGGGASLVAGPAWEGWIEPPLHTGLPVLYLADLDNTIRVPEGSKATIRLYGEVGALSVEQSVTQLEPDPSSVATVFTLERDGQIAISGPGGAVWDVVLSQDLAPVISPNGTVEASIRGEFKLPFQAQDDYGIEMGEAEIVLDLSRVDRRFGLVREPETRPAIRLPLPLPIAGDRTTFTQ